VEAKPCGLHDVFGLVAVTEDAGRQPHQPRPLDLELVTGCHNSPSTATGGGPPD